MEKIMASQAKMKRIAIATNEAGAPLTPVEAMRLLRDDIKGMETHSADGPLILVPKAEVLEMVQDWIEYLLNPNE